MGDRVIDLEPAVRSRKHLVRGIMPARFVVGYVALAMVMAATSWAFSSGAGPVVAVADVLAAAAVAVWAGRDLRRGSALAARLALGSALLALLFLPAYGLGIGLPADLAEAGDGLVTGLGEFITDRLDNLFGSGVSPTLSVLLLFLLLTAFAASGFSQALRQSRWLRVLRWPLLVVAAFVVSGLLPTVVHQLIERRTPIDELGALAALPVVAMAARAAVEVPASPAGDGLPPGWVPSTAPRRRRLFTGRRLVVVLLFWLLALGTGLVVALLQLLKSVPLVDPGFPGPAAPISGWALGAQVVVLLLGVQAYTLGRRHAALGAVEQQERDPRPWLLYLRSFRRRLARTGREPDPGRVRDRGRAGSHRGAGLGAPGDRTAVGHRQDDDRGAPARRGRARKALGRIRRDRQECRLAAHPGGAPPPGGGGHAAP